MKTEVAVAPDDVVHLPTDPEVRFVEGDSLTEPVFLFRLCWRWYVAVGRSPVSPNARPSRRINIFPVYVGWLMCRSFGVSTYTDG